MYFPLSLSDISLWLAVTAIILLVTSELLYSSPEYAARVMIDKKLLRLIALGCGLAFLVTVVMRVFQPF
jgi:Ni,Fe-hydrogenase I cytochrome b subunit